MKTLRLFIAGLLLAGVVFAANRPASPAANPPAVPADSNSDAAAAFAKLKSLAGEWEANTEMGKSHLTYEVISGGNSVVERELMEKEGVMLTVYSLDGPRILLTHYCMAGNAPRMQARAIDPESGELRFQFLDASNLTNLNAGHMHNVTLRFVDENHLTAAWQFYENGRQKFTETAQYSRIR